MAFQHLNALGVYLDNELVGALAISPDSKYVSFAYDPKWIKSGYSISPILFPLSNKVFTFPNISESTWHNFPPPIADSLPDKFGNAIIQSELAKQGITIDEITSLDRLAYVANHGMGALEYKPSLKFDLGKLSTLNISELVTVARSITFGEFSSESASKKAVASLLSVGTSAGGARPKAVINIDPSTSKITSGQKAKQGLESWLLKFDGVGRDKQLGETEEYGRIEYAYSLLANDCGINMSETRILEESGRAHFMTKRFDRYLDIEGNPHKVHMQTLCGMSQVDFNLKGTNDYAQLFSTMRKLNCPEVDISQAFRRMVFNFIFQNCDDHSKNHSFIYDKENDQWRLSPAYDITFAYNPDNEWLKEHLMGVMGKYSNVTKKDFMKMADQFKIQYARNTINELNKSIDKWSTFGKIAGLGNFVIESIGQCHEKISN